MHIVIDTYGDKQISRELLRFGERVDNARPLWTQIAKHLMEIENDQFDSQGQRSKAWAPLKPFTIAQKARHGLDPRILHATLELRKSLTIWGAPGQLLDINKESMRFGTKIKDAKYHYTGTKHMPSRKPINLTAKDRDDVVRMTHRYIIGNGEVNWSQGMTS